MTALPPPINPTVEAIEAVARPQSRPVRMSLSDIGKPCERSIWYGFRWATNAAPRPSRWNRAGDIAMAVKPLLTRWLTDTGVSVEVLDISTGTYHGVTALDGHFYSPIDGIATGIKEAPKTPHLVVTAALNTQAYRRTVKDGVAVANPAHLAKAQLGMHLRDLTRAIYVCCDRNDGSVHAERIHYDAAHAMAILARAERIKFVQRAPVRIADDPDHYQCRGCEAHSVCHGGAFPPRNCRTCLHSGCVQNGEWFCIRHDRELTTDDQRAGCPSHLYIPSLVTGDQIDADERAETVTYRLPDGREWVDGADRNQSSPELLQALEGAEWSEA
ncbi:hypothetical protein [Hoeflea alexandrii]|uniref:Oxidoreductase n=1 Tax=Hoeflea alexandrii TaxID=288436 RepID=A0ABT1CM92_9HYPH|nr:hypothetical protein [Hoeflea alexandrii]MCO6407329.1 oxidoreductase [Hoeflea alexandrii]MCY0154274.1 hypothetical protein [Hoeflea alexandrii]